MRNGLFILGMGREKSGSGRHEGVCPEYTKGKLGKGLSLSIQHLRIYVLRLLRQSIYIYLLNY